MANRKRARCPQCAGEFLRMEATEIMVVTFFQYEGGKFVYDPVSVLSCQPAPCEMEGWQPIQARCMRCAHDWIIPGPITDLAGFKNHRYFDVTEK